MSKQPKAYPTGGANIYASFPNARIPSGCKPGSKLQQPKAKPPGKLPNFVNKNPLR